MDYEADQVLQAYFRDNLARIARWFNIVAPEDGSMSQLRAQVAQLRDKDWSAIHAL